MINYQNFFFIQKITFITDYHSNNQSIRGFEKKSIFAKIYREMNKIINIFTFLFAAFLLFSCEPGRAENGDFLFGVNPGETGGGGNTNSRLLKKVITHLEDEDTGEMEDGVAIFNYNAGKLTSIDDSTSGTMKVEYNSNNKISKLLVDGAMTATYEYSGTTLSKITTEFTGISKSVTNYTFTAGKMVKSITVTELTFMPVPLKLYTEDIYEYQGNNVSKNITKIGAYDPVTGELIIDPGSVNTVFEYDSKKNPFTLLPKEYMYFYSSISPQTGYFTSANNPLKAIVTEQDGTATTSTTTHTYDDQDYVIKSTSGEEYYQFEYQN